MYVSVEAVHLSENLTDTNDIQTIRGGSMLMDRLADGLVDHLQNALGPEPKINKIIYGGNRVQLKCDADKAVLVGQVEAFCRRAPFCHLSLRWCVDEDKKVARGVAKRQLYEAWTIQPNTPFHEALPDRLDGFRPAPHETHSPDDDTPFRHLSDRSVAFRKIGSNARDNLTVLPPQSFEDIVSFPPDGVSAHAASKIAIVYADGSGFGGLHSKVDDVSKFMSERRAKLGEALSKWVKNGGDHTQYDGPKATRRSRFDILIWGGDDMTFVMPSWCLFEFLSLFFAHVDQWGQAEGIKITHRACAVIANHKTPIRLLRSLASTGQGQLKHAVEAREKKGIAKSSVFSVDVFESSAPPFDDLISYRRLVYGPDYHPEYDAYAPSDATGIVHYLDEQISGGQEGDGLSITQVHRLLEKLHQDGHRICSSRAAGEIEKAMASYSARTNRDTASQRAFAMQPMPVTLAKTAELYPYVSHMFSKGAQK